MPNLHRCCIIIFDVLHSAEMHHVRINIVSDSLQHPSMEVEVKSMVLIQLSSPAGEIEMICTNQPPDAIPGYWVMIINTSKAACIYTPIEE